ncbi:hypothetical protein ID866_206 [Astraeus odoratus]|nr:hypothetical protein ID866_206 [Astraeus odoratus]
MVRITQSSSTILIAMLLNSLVGIVLFVSILLLKQGFAGFSELAATVRWWTLIPGLLGSFFVFASISGYQNVGAATTIAVLVASQLIGGLVLDVLRSHGIPLRALIGPVCGAVMLVVGAWYGAALGQLFLARVHLLFVLLTVVRNRGTQTLLLGVTVFTAEIGIIAQCNQQFVHVGDDALFDGGIHAGDNFV